MKPATDYGPEYNAGNMADYGDGGGGGGGRGDDDIDLELDQQHHNNQNNNNNNNNNDYINKGNLQRGHQMVVANGGVDNDKNQQPHYMTGAVQGKSCSYFVNGDRYFTAKRIVLNTKYYRDMTHYMDHLTDRLNPSFGAIRKIHTPNRGRRIQHINELQPGECYVAAGGEKFNKLRYDQIISHERKRSPPFKYDANPVIHSRIFQSSGRIKKVESQSIIIKVWPNGGERKVRRPRVVLLRRTLGWNMAQVVETVNDMLKEDCNGPVEFLFTPNGIKMTDVDTLKHNGVYVALTKRDREVKRALYNDFATKDLHTSPRPDRKTLDPLFSRSNNSTSQSSPEHSNASSSQNTNNGHSRRRPPRKEEDQVFPAKPVKHNRTFEKTKKVDLDKDEGGVFKAKNSNNHTRGAREINDTRHTKTDLPVDQRKAQEVDEEIPDRTKEDYRSTRAHHPPPQNNKTEAKANTRRQHPHPRAAPAPKKENNNKKEKEFDEDLIRDAKKRREEAAIKIQAGYRGYSTRKHLAQTKAKQSHSYMTPSPPQSQRSRRQKTRTPVSQNKTRKSPTPPPPPQALDLEEEEKAATKIQAGYRGYATRKQFETEKAVKEESEARQDDLEKYQSIAKDEVNKMVDDTNNRISEEEKAATKIQAGFRGFQVRKDFEAKKGKNETLTRNEEEEKAATKIQAGIRGYQTRKSLRNHKSQRESPTNPTPVQQKPLEETPRTQPNYDDDDDDEDEEDDYDRAATKIQAGFRGYQVRKNLRA